MEPATASLDDGTLSRQPGGSRVIAGIDPGSKTSSLRQRLPVMLTEKECGRFFTKVFGPELQDFVDCKVELTLIFTNGKTLAGPSRTPPQARRESRRRTQSGSKITNFRVNRRSALLDLRVPHCEDADRQPEAASLSSGTQRMARQTSIHMRNASSLGDLRITQNFLALIAGRTTMVRMIQAWHAERTARTEVKTKSPCRPSRS